MSSSQPLTLAAAMVSLGLAGLGSHACSPQDQSLGEVPNRQQAAASKLSLAATSRALHAGSAAPYPQATAPLTWAEQHKVTANDGAAGDRFGGRVALDGDTAVVGAALDDDAGDNSGAAYVFVRSAEIFAQTQKLTASDGAAGDLFGYPSALDGDQLVIGASEDDLLGVDAGSAYVFTRNASSWTEQQKLTKGDTASSDHFGHSVAVDGDTIFVGAPEDDNSAGPNTGAVYVFNRNAAIWTEIQELSASDPAAYDNFGGIVALEGDTAIVGAPHDDSGAGTRAGSAYVFTRNAATWTERQKLVASDAAAYDTFGGAISLHANSAAIGAPGNDDAGDQTGSAYIFTRNAATWTEQQKLLGSDGAARDTFGYSVAMGIDTALVGAYFAEGTASNSGAVYVFTRNASSWTEETRLSASNGLEGDLFGFAVALSGDTAIAGAIGDRDAGMDSGSAYFMALRLVEGEACAADSACASKHCVDGHCCDRACDSTCERCDSLGLAGSCTPSTAGSTPTSSCDGYLCNGDLAQCPSSCSGDSDCSTDHFCRSAATCQPKAIDGQACGGNSGCISGHCVDGTCCAEACDEGCGSCIAAGLEGTCTPLKLGHPGTLSCAPYLCAGMGTACPSGCAGHDACAPGQHCEQGTCQPDGDQGAACSEDEACASGHCTDALCCVTETCGAYRCGSAGACEAACSSSAQCAVGHSCTSAGKCVARADAGSATENGGCQLTTVAAPPGHARPWLGVLGLLALLSVARGRNRTRHNAPLAGYPHRFRGPRIRHSRSAGRPSARQCI